MVLKFPLLPVSEAGQFNDDIIIANKVKISLSRLIYNGIFIQRSIVFEISYAWLLG